MNVSKRKCLEHIRDLDTERRNQQIEIKRLQEDCECYEGMKEGFMQRITDAEALIERLNQELLRLRTSKHCLNGREGNCRGFKAGGWE